MTIRLHAPARLALALLAISHAQSPAQTPQLVVDLQPGAASSSPSGLVCCWGNTLYFSADDPDGRKLWTTEPPARSATPVEALAQSVSHGEVVDCWVDDHAVVFFVASDGATGSELFAKTAWGTTMLDVNPSVFSANPYSLTRFDNRVYFGAWFMSAGTWPLPGLGWSDGTRSGTAQIGGSSQSRPDFAPCNGRLFLAAQQATTGRELFSITGGSLQLVADIDQSGLGASSSPRHLTCCGDTLVFSASVGTSREPWISDGTAAGTAMLADVYPGRIGSEPDGFTSCGGTVFFAARSSYSGRELWKTQLTPASTVLVEDIAAGWGGSDPQDLVCCDGKVLFTADDRVHGRELWISDGTSTGTRLVADIEVGAGSSSPSGLVCVGSRVYFAARTAATGTELWVSDGTASGTRIVSDLHPGIGSSDPADLTYCDGLLYFAADTPQSGRELYSVSVRTTAHRELLGEGCRAGLDLRMDSTPPVLGRDTVLSGTGAPGLTGVVCYGPPLDLPVPLFPGYSDCPAWFDRSSAATVGSPITTPTWNRKLFLPNDRALLGSKLVAQALFYEPRASLPRFASNAVRLVLGY